MESKQLISRVHSGMNQKLAVEITAVGCGFKGHDRRVRSPTFLPTTSQMQLNETFSEQSPNIVSGNHPEIGYHSTLSPTTTLKMITVCRLSTMFPDKLIVAIELRVKVAEYVSARIAALRIENAGAETVT